MMSAGSFGGVDGALCGLVRGSHISSSYRLDWSQVSKRPVCVCQRISLTGAGVFESRSGQVLAEIGDVKHQSQQGSMDE